MNATLIKLHALCTTLDPENLNLRLIVLCDFFLGYRYGAWQEGATLESLDDFNYNLELLDCVTFVEVVLAAAKTPPHQNYATFKDQFETTLSKIHYANGIRNYLSSNHFMCLDWIPNNSYMLEDITNALTPEVKIAAATIDKASWMQRKKQLFPVNMPPQYAEVPYIETPNLLENYASFVKNFPDSSIINIVRPNWDLTATIGTHLNISHLGLAFKNQHTADLDFYHATSEKMLVVKETLDIYMQRFKDSPTIRGINVLAISPGYANAW
jgi:hypothetical protein